MVKVKNEWHQYSDVSVFVIRTQTCALLSCFVTGKLQPCTKPQTEMKGTLPAVERPVTNHPRRKKEKISLTIFCFSTLSDIVKNTL
jgi:hypothetical protein